MRSPASILDASAPIAFLHDEPGADAVVDALATTAAISVVNWAEALSKVAADGDDPQRVADSLQADDAPLQLESLAETRLRHDRPPPPAHEHTWPLARRSRLPGARLDLPVLTADREWTNLELGVRVQLR